MPPVGSKRLCVLATLIALGASAQAAAAQPSFHPRLGGAMGIIPPQGRQEIAAGPRIAVVFHAGVVMRQVTVHTLFWAPSGYSFSGPPTAGSLSYEQLIQQFFTDVAHDSGMSTNAFSVLPQYGDGGGAGSYSVSYDAATDSIDDSDPYPSPSQQCASPAGIATCVTDLAIQRELDRVVKARAPSGRGLHDLWLVFLPPDVDSCFLPGGCGTTVFAGYHSLSNLGSGPTVYALVVDPLIEGTPHQGADPEGNPEAEVAVDVAAHEAVEAFTDPYGTGWMDPNGFETADKCDTQRGTPLGYAANGSPYNQLINGHQYLIQSMWSNAIQGCAQRSTSTSAPLPLATVDLRQFSRLISGDIGKAKGGVPVTAVLARTGRPIAGAGTTTRPDGSWGPVALQHAVGDDRDEILIEYGSGGPPPDLIETGDSGDPFGPVQAGYTGWFDLDHGYAVRSSSILLSPCTQTGVLSVTINGKPTPPPVEQCETESDLANVATGPLNAGTVIKMSSEDNRAAIAGLNADGALVKLTIPIGEPNSISAVGNDLILPTPSGFPTCTADLRAQTARCTGLVPGAGYNLTRRRGQAARHGRADDNGVLHVGGFPGAKGITRGDTLTLTNGARRTLTTLHVAHLRVDVRGEDTVIAGGSCEPADYWGPPLNAPPVSRFVGVPGVGGKGRICPPSGRARGLPTADIAQTDELSGGQTVTEVPDIEATSPIDGETLYGPFIALARTGLPGPNGSIVPVGARVSLTITPAGGRAPVFRARNVTSGVTVRALRAGSYVAKWVLTDAGGDTRTVQTRFVEERI